MLRMKLSLILSLAMRSTVNGMIEVPLTRVEVNRDAQLSHVLKRPRPTTLKAVSDADITQDDF